MDIAGGTIVQRRPEVVEAEVADTQVLLNEELRYSGLDQVGRRIWQLLATPQTVDDLVATLLEEYNVAPETCRSDVLGFLRTLDEQHLVTVR